MNGYYCKLNFKNFLSVEKKLNHEADLDNSRKEKKTIGTGKIHSSEMQFTTRMKKLGFSLMREGQLQTIIANMWIARNVGKEWKELFENKRTSFIFDLLVIANRKSTLYFKIIHIDKIVTVPSIC